MIILSNQRSGTAYAGKEAKQYDERKQCSIERN